MQPPVDGVTLLASVAAPYITQYLKGAKWFTWLGNNQDGRAILVVTIISGVGVLVSTQLDTQSQTQLLTTLLDALARLVISVAAGTGFYHHFVKDKKEATVEPSTTVEEETTSNSTDDIPQ